MAEPARGPALTGCRPRPFPRASGARQVETTEAVAPVLITRRELIPGQWRAGTDSRRVGTAYRNALCRRMRISCCFLSVGTGSEPCARAVSVGGKAHRGASASARVDPDLPGKGEVRVKAGDTLIFETPGGGGFGNPQDRSRGRMFSRDLDEGLISREGCAHEIYGMKP